MRSGLSSEMQLGVETQILHPVGLCTALEPSVMAARLAACAALCQRSRGMHRRHLLEVGVHKLSSSGCDMYVGEQACKVDTVADVELGSGGMAS